MRFGFLITARCNAACAHCTTNSGPYEEQELRADTVADLMDQAAALWQQERAPGERLEFCFSGGEPFTDFARLVGLVRHGAGLGAAVTCVTNGSWAVSDERARDRVAQLKEAGLTTLGVSTSRFHQQFVKRDRVRRALDAAREAGIRTALKCAITAVDRDGPHSLEQWARARHVDKLELFAVTPYVRIGAALPEDDFLRTEGIPAGRCPAATLTVREDGRAYTCCMPGAFTDFLKVGNVFETSLAVLYDRFYLEARQRTLRHRGPRHFARAVIAAGQGARLRDRYESVCDLCAHIARDPVMAPIAARAAEQFADEQLRAAMARPTSASLPAPTHVCQGG